MSKKQVGLFYRRADGVEVPQSGEGEQWLVTLHNAGGVQLHRFIDGVTDETYREMDDSEGVLAIAGAILGFEPRRALIRRDRRVR